MKSPSTIVLQGLHEWGIRFFNGIRLHVIVHAR